LALLAALLSALLATLLARLILLLLAALLAAATLLLATLLSALLLLALFLIRILIHLSSSPGVERPVGRSSINAARFCLFLVAPEPARGIAGWLGATMRTNYGTLSVALVAGRADPAPYFDLAAGRTALSGRSRFPNHNHVIKDRT
jgi:hypothetical protein